MTHVGPHSSGTTVDRMFRRYYSGSKTLDKYLEASNDNSVMWIHGHTHNGVGIQETNRKPILNPGSLSLGRFAVVVLQRKDSIWALSEVKLINLNND